MDKPSFALSTKVPTRLVNAVAIGGMIAMGKTTLVDGLVKSLAKVNAHYELDGDPLLENMLQAMYAKKLTPDVMQLYFLNNRSGQYRQWITASQPDELLVLDRTIIEDRLFAYVGMAHLPRQFRYYEGIWEEKMEEMLHTLGVPKLYIMLHGSFDTFRERIFKRNRKSEIDNWTVNEEYFKTLYGFYRPYMQSICRAFGIKLIEIEVDTMTPEMVLAYALEKIAVSPDLRRSEG